MIVNLNTDTKKLKEAGTNIVDLSFELLDVINSFYDRIGNIPTKTREWVGKESLSYTKLCISEKDEYVKFINSLKLVGENLILFSNDFENRINAVEEELCQK